jgi:endonuclease G
MKVCCENSPSHRAVVCPPISVPFVPRSGATLLDDRFHAAGRDVVALVVASPVDGGRVDVGRFVRLIGWVAVAIALPCVASTARADCHDHFAGGVEPKTLSSPAADRPHLLCFTSYAVLSSGVTRTAVWSAEALSRESVLAAGNLPRDNVFHAEDSIARSDRAELGDYAKSGWDRGHMAPSGDMPDAQSQAESFSLANMIPQAPQNNRRLWEHIESTMRRFAKSSGNVYIVTGPGYTSAKANLLNGRVRIPDLVWKAVYVPQRGAAAYLVRNDSGRDYSVVSIAEITRITGIDPFPSLDTSDRQTAIELPSPSPHKGEGKDIKVAQTTLLGRPPEENPEQRRTARAERVSKGTVPKIDIDALLQALINEVKAILARILR